MNWSEPSIRAEQALKRANQAAENKDYTQAYAEWRTVIEAAHLALDSLVYEGMASAKVCQEG